MNRDKHSINQDAADPSSLASCGIELPSMAEMFPQHAPHPLDDPESSHDLLKFMVLERYASDSDVAQLVTEMEDRIADARNEGFRAGHIQDN